MSLDDPFIKPHAIQTLESERAAADIDDNFDAIWSALQKLREEVTSGTSSSGSNPLLDGNVHSDTVADTPVSQDLIVANAAAKWARKAVGSAGQFLRIVAGLVDWATVTIADFTHNLLSSGHPDTTPAAVTKGAMVVGQQDILAVTDTEKYWIDGEAFHAVASENDPYGLRYWIDGEPMPELVSGTVLGPVTWRHFPPGTAGQVLTMQTTGMPGWDSASASGTGARVYRSTSQVLVWGTPTAIIFDTIEQDDASYFSLGQPTRFTAPATGWYLCAAQGTAPFVHVGLFEIAFKVNGSLRVAFVGVEDNATPSWGTDYNPKILTFPLYLTAGQYVEMWMTVARNSLGSPETLVGGQVYLHFSIVRIG